MKKLESIELFSGAGGLALGLLRFGLVRLFLKMFVGCCAQRF